MDLARPAFWAVPRRVGWGLCLRFYLVKVSVLISIGSGIEMLVDLSLSLAKPAITRVSAIYDGKLEGGVVDM